MVLKKQACEDKYNPLVLPKPFNMQPLLEFTKHS